MKRSALGVAGALAAPLVLTVALAIAAGQASAGTSPTVSITECESTVAAGARLADGSTLTSEQIGSATIIYQVSVDLKLPTQAAVIGIATAMQESSLINRTNGDADSVGLFQQRPSQGWGAPNQLVDPVFAAKAFYSRLVKVSGWQNLPVTQAAQDVQRSAHPDAYAKWETLARQLAATAGGSATSCLGSKDDGTGAATKPVHLPKDFHLPASTPRQIAVAIKYGTSKVGMPYQWGGTGNPSYDCSGLMMMSYQAAGVTITRTTFTQVHDGTPVYLESDLKPGDLIFTAGTDGTPDNPGHVGMYLGSNLVLDGPRSGKNIQVTRYENGYWNKQAVAFRRIVAWS